MSQACSSTLEDQMLSRSEYCDNVILPRYSEKFCNESRTSSLMKQRTVFTLQFQSQELHGNQDDKEHAPKKSYFEQRFEMLDIKVTIENIF